MTLARQILNVLSEGTRDPQLGHVYDDGYLYHATDGKNVPSIKRTGLTSGYPETFDDQRSKDMVHLAPDLDSTEYWFGRVDSRCNGKAVLLRVKKSDVHIIQSYRKDEVLTAKVPSNVLEILSGTRWNKL